MCGSCRICAECFVGTLRRSTEHSYTLELCLLTAIVQRIQYGLSTFADIWLGESLLEDVGMLT
jgi:hypothetical protein